MSITAPLGFVQRGFGVQTKITQMENLRQLERLHEQCAHILQRIRRRVDQIEEIEWQSTTGFLRRELAAQRIRMAKRMGILLEEAYQSKMQALTV